MGIVTLTKPDNEVFETVEALTMLGKNPVVLLDTDTDN